MNSNFKRKLLAGLFVPVLGLTVGSALAQSTGTTGSQGGAPSAQGSGTTGGSATTQSGGSMGTSATGSVTGSTGAMWNKDHFDRLDKNRDGRISREEAQADNVLKDAWTKLDSANRGSVSRDDFDAYARTLNPNSSNPMQNNVPGKGPQK